MTNSFGKVMESMGMVERTDGLPSEGQSGSLGGYLLELTAKGMRKTGNGLRWTVATSQRRRNMFLAAICLSTSSFLTHQWRDWEASDTTTPTATALLKLEANGVTDKTVAKNVNSASYDVDKHELTFDLVNKNENPCKAKFEVAEDYTYLAFGEQYNGVIKSSSNELDNPHKVNHAFDQFLGSVACNPQSK